MRAGGLQDAPKEDRGCKAGNDDRLREGAKVEGYGGIRLGDREFAGSLVSAGGSWEKGVGIGADMALAGRAVCCVVELLKGRCASANEFRQRATVIRVWCEVLKKYIFMNSIWKKKIECRK